MDICAYSRADSRFAPSQWETSLQSNAVSHWLGVNLESALLFCVWPLNVRHIPKHVCVWKLLFVAEIYICNAHTVQTRSDHIQRIYRDNSRFAPSQWEMALLCSNISYWLGTSLESDLIYCALSARTDHITGTWRCYAPKIGIWLRIYKALYLPKHLDCPWCGL